MAATENSANTLKINIVADANPAKQALADVGKAAIETKEKIEGLGKAFSDSTKRITDLTHDVNTLRTAIGQKSFGLTGMEDSARRIEVHLNNAISLANRLAKTSFANNGFAAAEKSVDRIIAKMREPIDAFRVKEDSMAKAEAWLADMRKKFSRPISVFEVTRANTKKLENLLNLLNADREKRGAYIKSEIELLREQRLNYRAAQEAAKAAGEAQVGMARTYKNVLKAQESLIGAKDLKAIATLNATQGAGGNKTVIVDKSKHVNNQRGVHALPANGGFVPIPGGFRTFVGAMGARDAWNNIVSLQQRQARVSAWNLTPTQQAKWNMQRDELLRNNTLIDKAEAESMMMAASSSLGHYDPEKVGGTVGAATKYAQLERIMGYNKSEADDIVKNYYGVAEARQVTNDVQKVLDTFKTVFNITTTTAGKISVADVETIMRNMGPGAATISDEGLLRLLAYAEQIKVAGKGSSGSTGAGISTVGTNVKMLQLMAMGKPSSINAKKALAELGLMDDDAYRAYDEEGNLAYHGNKSEGSDKAYQLANAIFNRGDYGQILGSVFTAGSKELANAGAFNKELAQKDPVKWVEEITHLIEAYVTKAENRSVYFGEEGRKSLEKGEKDEDFYRRVGKEMMNGAVTTFWAKTGLSQRVLTALSTFSNRNFQLRSKEMMDTAKNQKSADDLYREQIEAGNLAMASERLKKSIIRLTEAFEPMTQWIGKAAVAISDIIDKVTQWVKDWQGLAAVSAGWIVVKSLTSALKILGFTYADVARKQLEVAATAKEMTVAQSAGATASATAQPSTVTMANKAQTTRRMSIFTGVSQAFNQTYDKVSGWVNRVKSRIATIGVALTRCVNAFGVALLAFDLGSIIVGWIADFTTFGKRCKEIWADVVSAMNNSHIVLNATLNNPESRSAVDNGELEKLYQQRDKKESRYEELRDQLGDGGLDADELKEWTRLGDELQKLNENIKNLEQKPVAEYKTAKEKGDAFIAKFQEQGIVAKYDAYNKAQSDYINLVKKAEVSRVAEGGNTEVQKYYQEQIAKLLEEKNKAQAELKDALNDTGLSQAAQGFSDAVGKASSLAPKVRAMSDLYDGLEKLFISSTKETADAIKGLLETLRKSIGASAETGVDVTGIGLIRDTVDVHREGEQSQADSYSHGINKKLDEKNKPASQEELEEKERRGTLTEPQYAQLLKMRGGKRVSRVSKWIDNQNKSINKYKSRLLDADEFESYNDTYERMEKEFVSQVLAGKFKKGNDNPFMKKEPKQKNTEGFTEDDVDLDTHFNGVSGKDMIEKMTYQERLRMFTSNFSSFFKTASNNLKEAELATQKAATSMDDFSAAYTDSDEIQKIDAEIARIKKAAATYGAVNSKQTNQVLNKLQDQRGKAAKEQLYIRAKSDSDYVREYNTSKLTSKQQTVENYVRQTKLEEAQYTQTIRQIQESVAIGEEEKNALIEKAKEEHDKKMLAMEDEYQRKMQGYDDTYLKQKIENWRDSGSYMKEMQDTIMDGFVTANEKWLDGDKNSWRDYLNDILKMWRHMVLQMGFSKLLGGLTDKFTGGAKSFLDGVFGLVEKKDTTATQSVDNLEKQQKSVSAYDYDLGSRYQTQKYGAVSYDGWGALGYKATPTYGFDDNGFTLNRTPASDYKGLSQGSSFGLSSNYSLLDSSNDTAGSSGWGLKMPSSGGLGSGGSGTDGGMDFGGLNSQIGETSSALGTMTQAGSMLSEMFGASTETTQGLNVTLAAMNVVTTLSNGIAKIKNLFSTQENSTTAQGVAEGTLFNGGLTAGTAGLTAFTAQLAAAGATATATAAIPHANGGVMTSKGSMPLKYYSNGGIAKKAQVAVFGEGSKPEAYVPLPDGRSIPVTMKMDGLGGESDSVGGNQVVINISVNNNGGSTTETESSDGSSSKADDMRTLANNIKAAVKNEIYNQSRPGGLLYNPR
nr:MAG TPA: chromosome segregation protein [Caudoviricetes sp.]